MGVSTNSHKDPKGNTDQEFGLRVKPIHKEDSKTSMPEDHHHNRMNILSVQECDQDHQENEQNQLRFKFNNIIAPVPVSMSATPPSSPHHLKLKKLEMPSYKVQQEKNDNNNDDLNDGFKTPTSLDHKIQPMLECPGAPRKKITRSPPMKRRLMFDRSKELDSMFTISFMEDLDGVKNKKLKRCMLME